MRFMTFLARLLVGVSLSVAAGLGSRVVGNDPMLHLSPGASISHDLSTAPRFSEFHAPQPGTIVNVATEADVATTVRPHIHRSTEGTERLTSYRSSTAVIIISRSWLRMEVMAGSQRGSLALVAC
jgi:hypothetical protein